MSTQTAHFCTHGVFLPPIFRSQQDFDDDLLRFDDEEKEGDVRSSPVFFSPKKVRPCLPIFLHARNFLTRALLLVLTPSPHESGIFKKSHIPGKAPNDEKMTISLLRPAQSRLTVLLNSAAPN